MVVILKAYRVTTEGHVFGGVIIHKWQNDELPTFELSSYENWKRYLSKLKVADKRGQLKYLPRTSGDGFKIAYRVHTWGGKVPIHDFFPGKDANGGKRYLLHYGQLYPLKKQEQ